MIKFFRRVRQRLLSENKFSKYLLYAIGEIVLVVIGILIALQINNWNESRKVNQAKTKTLQHIKKEILSNQKFIKSVDYYHQMVRDTLKKIKPPETEEELTKALSFWREFGITRLRNSAFETAVQSGTTKELDVILAENLNALYATQNAYNDFGQTASNALYDQDFSDVSNFGRIAVFLNMVMSDLYYFEIDLKEQYSRCLDQIDSLNTN